MWAQPASGNGFRGKRQSESGALPRAAFGRDGTTQPAEDLLTNGQPQTAALIFAAAVQPFEGLEDLLQINLVKTYPLVRHAYFDPIVRERTAPDRDVRLYALCTELQRVGDEILEYVTYLHPVRVNDR